MDANVVLCCGIPKIIAHKHNEYSCIPAARFALVNLYDKKMA